MLDGIGTVRAPFDARRLIEALALSPRSLDRPSCISTLSPNSFPFGCRHIFVMRVRPMHVKQIKVWNVGRNNVDVLFCRNGQC
jgi:hypothetical protein